MVENKLDFVPVVPDTMVVLGFIMTQDLLPKAKEEYELMYPNKDTLNKKVISALKTLQDGFFVMYGGSILGAVGRKKIVQNGKSISCLFASTTKWILKYPVQYYKATKKFISDMAKDSDILLFSVPEGFDRAISIIDRLGFTTISIDDVNGRKIITKILRCEHGMVR
jgi:hypothetical protein